MKCKGSVKATGCNSTAVQTPHRNSCSECRAWYHGRIGEGVLNVVQRLPVFSLSGLWLCFHVNVHKLLFRCVASTSSNPEAEIVKLEIFELVISWVTLVAAKCRYSAGCVAMWCRIETVCLASSFLSANFFAKVISKLLCLSPLAVWRVSEWVSSFLTAH